MGDETGLTGKEPGAEGDGQMFRDTLRIHSRLYFELKSDVSVAPI